MSARKAPKREALLASFLLYLQKMHLRLPLSFLVCLALALSLVPTTAITQTSGHLQIAISDENPQTFAQPAMQRLGITQARMVVPWNVVSSPRWRAQASAWLASAAAYHVSALVAFQHDSSSHAPTLAAYRRAFLSFRRLFPQVTTFTPWDEVNDGLQPTFRHPALAADYYNVIVQACPTCTVVAGDLLDTSNMLPYLRAYIRALKTTPQIWGLHDYGDANYLHSSATLAFLRAVRGTVWLTETGGIVNLGHLHYNIARATKATSFILHLAEVEPRIARIYLYNWFGTTTPKSAKRHLRVWDSGFIGTDHKLRPSYQVALQAAQALGQ